jgi:hypothetical protein
MDALPVRFSHLRAYGRSAMHGKAAREREAAETTAMQRGTAVHALVFGTRKVCAYPGPVRRGKEYEAFYAEHADHEILTMAEYDKARRMADAVRQSSVAEPYLKGVAERTMLFRWNGLECRATPDLRGQNFITELKTSATSDPVRFVWHALKMNYHAQMRMQQLAYRCEDECFIVCVEAADPFPVTVFRIDERALEVGYKLLMLWSERMKNAVASNLYPPYVSCVVPLDVPDEEEALVFADAAADPFDEELAEQA